jgi:hypothetical protein
MPIVCEWLRTIGINTVESRLAATAITQGKRNRGLPCHKFTPNDADYALAAEVNFTATEEYRTADSEWLG